MSIRKKNHTLTAGWMAKTPPGNLETYIRYNKNTEGIHRSGNTWREDGVPELLRGKRAVSGSKTPQLFAGLGTIGKNNLLITKEYGPRVRLRAMFLSVDLPSTGPGDWDPCAGCDMPCRKKCPQNAFDRITYEAGQYGGLTKLPGRDGSYSLLTCDRQMAEDEENEIKNAYGGSGLWHCSVHYQVLQGV